MQIALIEIGKGASLYSNFWPYNFFRNALVLKTSILNQNSFEFLKLPVIEQVREKISIH